MSAVQEKAIAKQHLQQRDFLWPNVAPYVWDHRANKGFAFVPKTMPLILRIMDDLSPGKPLSSTYLGLWCETWETSLINTSKHQDLAYAAGFTGQRAVYTWAGRVQLLRELSFIDVKPGKSGAISHVLIWNPHLIIRLHHRNRQPGLVEANFNALIERAMEVGASDMLANHPSTEDSSQVEAS